MKKLVREEKKCQHSIADTLYTCFTKIKLLHEGKNGKSDQSYTFGLVNLI